MNADASHINTAASRCAPDTACTTRDECSTAFCPAGVCAQPADAAQCGLDTTAVAADVVGVHRLGQDHIAVGIEATGQLLAVVLQVGLHRVPAAAQRVLALLAVPAEAGDDLGLAVVQLAGEALQLLQRGPDGVLPALEGVGDLGTDKAAGIASARSTLPS